MAKNTQTVIKAGTFYTIAGSTGRVVEAVETEANGAAIVLGNYDHKPTQEWAFTRVGEGVYQIANRATGKMIDLVSGGSSDGTWLHQWDDAGCSSQMWMVEPTNDGHVKIKSQISLEKCIDVVGMSTEPGTRLQVWQDVNGENQSWVISAVVAKRTRTVKTPEEKAAAAAKKAATAAKKPAAAKTTAKKPAAKKATTTKTTKAATTKAATTKKATATKTTKAAAKTEAAK